MADRDNARGPIETIALAGLGALALAAGRADELSEAIASQLGVEQEEVRAAVADVLGSWRREAARLGERTSGTASNVAEELGLASRDAVDDLSLRVAQLEHRLKLLERPD